MTDEMIASSPSGRLTVKNRKRLENTFGSFSQFVRFCVSTGRLKLRDLDHAELLGSAILPNHIIFFCTAISQHKGRGNKCFAKSTLHTMVAGLKRFFLAYNRCQASDGGLARISVETINQITKLTEQFKQHVKRGKFI